MRKTIEVTIPTSWAEISLKKYLALQSDLENYKDDEEAQTAFLLHHLCGIGLEELQTLPADTYNQIKMVLLEFINKTELPLERTLTIDGVEYGFEPNLSKMSYGAFVDITKFEQLTIDKNWAKIMSILYRPIENKKGDTYSIKTYDGTIDETRWLEVGMHVHFGCLFFFVNLLTDLLNSTLNSTIPKMAEAHPEYKQLLVRSGEVMQRLLNLPTETSERLMK